MAGNDVKAQDGEIKVFGLVRNAKGQPQFDDYFNIPKEFHHVLTEEDWQYIKEMQDGSNALNTD